MSMIIKFLCIKKSSGCCEKGNIYTFEENIGMKLDDGNIIGKDMKLKSFKKEYGYFMKQILNKEEEFWERVRNNV